MDSPGRKSRWSDAQRAQIAEMLKRGMTQAEVAKFFNTSQQAISILARTFRETGIANKHDPSDPISFTVSFDDDLRSLRAIAREHVNHPPAWGDKALKARRDHFRGRR